MTRPRVALGIGDRWGALRESLEKIEAIELETLVLSVSATHAHLLANFEGRDVGREVGRLKRASSHALRDRFPGGLWSRRCHVVTIRSREHHARVFDYIVEHGRLEHASVWTFRDPIPGLGD
ncbi:MAG: hypothetical protein R3B57_00740 [Phycisphaerales bacterium]